jgi:hypothetical protein
MGREATFSVDGCIGLPPGLGDPGRDRIYQCDIILIDACQSALEVLREPIDGATGD